MKWTAKRSFIRDSLLYYYLHTSIITKLRYANYSLIKYLIESIDFMGIYFFMINFFFIDNNSLYRILLKLNTVVKKRGGVFFFYVLKHRLNDGFYDLKIFLSLNVTGLKTFRKLKKDHHILRLLRKCFFLVEEDIEYDGWEINIDGLNKWKRLSPYLHFMLYDHVNEIFIDNVDNFGIYIFNELFLFYFWNYEYNFKFLNFGISINLRYDSMIAIGVYDYEFILFITKACDKIMYVSFMYRLDIYGNVYHRLSKYFGYHKCEFTFSNAFRFWTKKEYIGFRRKDRRWLKKLRPLKFGVLAFLKERNYSFFSFQFIEFYDYFFDLINLRLIKRDVFKKFEDIKPFEFYEPASFLFIKKKFNYFINFFNYDYINVLRLKKEFSRIGISFFFNLGLLFLQLFNNTIELHKKSFIFFSDDNLYSGNCLSIFIWKLLSEIFFNDFIHKRMVYPFGFIHKHKYENLLDAVYDISLNDNEKILNFYKQDLLKKQGVSLYNVFLRVNRFEYYNIVNVFFCNFFDLINFLKLQNFSGFELDKNWDYKQFKKYYCDLPVCGNNEEYLLYSFFLNVSLHCDLNDSSVFKLFKEAYDLMFFCIFLIFNFLDIKFLQEFSNLEEYINFTEFNKVIQELFIDDEFFFEEFVLHFVGHKLKRGKKG